MNKSERMNKPDEKKELVRNEASLKRERGRECKKGRKRKKN